MPDADHIQDLDFDSQLRGLFHEAEQHIEDRSTSARRANAKREQAIQGEEQAKESEAQALRAYASLPQMLRPVLLGIQAAVRATGENTLLLQKLGEKLEEKLEEKPEELPAVPSALQNLTENLRALLDQKNGVNQKMFAALHEELKGYKDGFLLESVHKPIIRDLISLYDDLSAIHGQMQETVLDTGKTPGIVGSALLERLKTMEMNIEHNCGFILEVLARLEVTPVPVSTGKLDMLTQRALSIEVAEDPDEDGDIVRTLKPGFVWKGRVFRPEEVVMKKWKEGFLVALAPASSQR